MKYVIYRIYVGQASRRAELAKSIKNSKNIYNICNIQNICRATKPPSVVGKSIKSSMERKYSLEEIYIGLCLKIVQNAK